MNRKPRILIVEDDAKYRHFITQRLTHSGYQVLIASEGLIIRFDPVGFVDAPF